MEREDPHHDRKDLAKQLVTYADAVTAFSFVQSVAFGFALAQHEVRESLLKISGDARRFTLIAYVLYLIIVIVCLIGNRILLCVSKEDTATCLWSWIMWGGRIVVIAFALILSRLAICWTINGSSPPDSTPPIADLVKPYPGMVGGGLAVIYQDVVPFGAARLMGGA